ncbi:MAG: peptide-methionine (S)-S-oxide reductase MsrA [Candidatus Puniceispirillales bacterium]
MFANLLKPMTVLGREEALPGRDTPILDPLPHAVLGNPIVPPFPEGFGHILFGLGCFWGAERLFWQLPGVWTTSVGYAGGHTPNPTYREVCSGGTGHTEIVEVVFDPAVIGLNRLLQVFWESHDPTQGMRQGNDVGTQYRSAIYADNAEHLAMVEASRDSYAKALRHSGRGAITTEIALAGDYYLAEDYHQQYLHKNPGGYCGLQGTGVSCPA